MSKRTQLTFHLIESKNNPKTFATVLFDDSQNDHSHSLLTTTHTENIKLLKEELMWRLRMYTTKYVALWETADVKSNDQMIPNQTGAKDTELIQFVDVNLLPDIKIREHQMET